MPRVESRDRHADGDLKTDYNTFQTSVFKELISLQKSKFDFRQAYEPTYMITTNIPEVQF